MSNRYVSASCVLDYDTVGGADKFGNVWVLQLPYKANDDIDNPTGSRMLWDQGLLNGAPTKAKVLSYKTNTVIIISSITCPYQYASTLLYNSDIFCVAILLMCRCSHTSILATLLLA